MVLEFFLVLVFFSLLNLNLFHILCFWQSQLVKPLPRECELISLQLKQIFRQNYGCKFADIITTKINNKSGRCNSCNCTTVFSFFRFENVSRVTFTFAFTILNNNDVLTMISGFRSCLNASHKSYLFVCCMLSTLAHI